MNKKEYQKPTIKVVTIAMTSIICTSVKNIEGNAGLKLGGAGSGDARSRSFGGWDDEE